MSDLLLARAACRVDNGTTLVHFDLSSGPNRHEIWFRITGSQAPPRPADLANSALAASLLPAMKLGQPLSIPGPVSPRLLGSVAEIQDLFHGWFSEFQRIPVRPTLPRSPEPDRTSPKPVPASAAAAAESAGVGAFFSAGVDSFYTLLKHQEEITRIICVHGFDIWLREEPFRAKVLAEVRQAAQALGKPMLFVETNLHEVSDLYAEWGHHYHGAALATVALLLAPELQKVYVPSSYPYARLFPWGSHPLLDRLWSTETLQFVHDGCEATRIEKVARVAQSEAALRALRVCLDRTDGAYNCGHCEKCVRTMVNLRLVGALDRCTTFSRKLDLKTVAEMPIAEEHDAMFTLENLRAAQRLGTDPELTAALQCSLDRYAAAEFARRLRAGLFASPSWEGIKADVFQKWWAADHQWLTRRVRRERLKRWSQIFRPQ